MDPELVVGVEGAAPAGVATPAVETSVQSNEGAVAPVIPAVTGDAAPPAATESPAVTAEPIVAPKVEASLLGAEAPIEQKPTEAAKDGEEQKPVDAPVITYEAFKFPDGLEVAPERIGAFTEVAAGLRLTQDQAQSLLDLHAQEIQAASNQRAQSELDRQYSAFHDLRRGWRETIQSDPVIGGNRLHTTINEVISLRNQYVTDAQHLRDLSDAFNATGIGDHPAFIRWMHNVYNGTKNSFVESESPMTGAPVPQASTGSRYAKRYTASKRG